MGREVRRVPADWEHPKDEQGNCIPMYARSYREAWAEWVEERDQWHAGFVRSYKKTGPKWLPKSECKHAKNCQHFEDWNGTAPNSRHHMPDWPDEERTHLMMYEDTSEGTPISPAFETPEELARWLADTGASAFADMTATYEQWLAMIQRGWAPSAVAITGKPLQSGVEALAD